MSGKDDLPFNPLDPFGLWTAFVQPILPGWQIGNLIVNAANSSSPETERRILAQESYGRQLGKLTDAVCALIELQGGPGQTPAFRELIALRERIEAMKETDDEFAEIRRGLERLKARDPERYRRTAAALRELLA